MKLKEYFKYKQLMCKKYYKQVDTFKNPIFDCNNCPFFNKKYYDPRYPSDDMKVELNRSGYYCHGHELWNLDYAIRLVQWFKEDYEKEQRKQKYEELKKEFEK